MRSDLVFGAMTIVPNRYLLAQLASKAARKLHKPGSRMQDTMNDVLLRFNRANPIGSEQTLPEPLLLPEETRSVVPHKSKVAPRPPAREDSNPFAMRAHSSGNSPRTTLGFQTYSDARAS